MSSVMPEELPFHLKIHLLGDNWTSMIFILICAIWDGMGGFICVTLRIYTDNSYYIIVEVSR